MVANYAKTLLLIAPPGLNQGVETGGGCGVFTFVNRRGTYHYMMQEADQ